MTRIAAALALHRPQPLRLALPLAALRAVAAAGALAFVLALAYAAAGSTSLFAVRAIEVSGAPPDVARHVRAVAAPLAGRSLIGLDGDDLVARLEALPSVRSARYDRAFPSTLRIAVRPERPLGLVKGADGVWLVSARGRAIARVERRELGRLPRISAASAPTVGAGETIGNPEVRLALRALARVPRDFPARLVAARAREGAVTIVLAGRTELRLGRPHGLQLKLAVAAAVLAAVPPRERSSLAYLDVTVPERVVAGESLNSELEVEGPQEKALEITG